jgi:hypothetical protein
LVIQLSKIKADMRVHPFRVRQIRLIVIKAVCQCRLEPVHHQGSDVAVAAPDIRIRLGLE